MQLARKHLYLVSIAGVLARVRGPRGLLIDGVAPMPGRLDARKYSIHLLPGWNQTSDQRLTRLANTGSE